jgi:aconitase A
MPNPRSNLIAQGILPLVLASEADYERVRQGATWRLVDVRKTLSAGGEDLAARNEADEEIPLKARLLSREREILLAGGKRRYLRDSGCGEGTRLS